MSKKSRTLVKYLYWLSQQSLRFYDLVRKSDGLFRLDDHVALMCRFVISNHKLQSCLLFKPSSGFDKQQVVLTYVTWLLAHKIILRNHPCSSIHRFIKSVVEYGGLGDVSLERREDAVCLVTSSRRISLPRDMTCLEGYSAASSVVAAPICEVESVQKTNFSIFESRNERYGDLISLGLEPELWLSSDLTTPELRELKRIYRAVRQCSNDIAFRDCMKESIWEHCFSQVVSVSDSPLCGRFSSFREFSYSPIGQELLKQHASSFDSGFEPIDALSEDVQESSDRILGLSNMRISAQHKDMLSKMIDSYLAKRIQPVERYVLLDVLCDDDLNNALDSSWYTSRAFRDALSISSSYRQIQSRDDLLSKLEERINLLLRVLMEKVHQHGHDNCCNLKAFND